MFEALERCITPFGQKNHRRRFPKTTASSQPRSRLRKKQRNYCAQATRQHRRNEWAQWRALLCQAKRSGRVARIVAQEAAEPSSQPVNLGLASAANSRTDSSNPILNPKRSIH